MEEESFSAAGYNLLLHDSSVVNQILTLIKLHPDRNDLVVRLAFCLGNFAASHDQCRLDIAENPIASEFLPRLLARYVEEAKTDSDAAEKAQAKATNAGRMLTENDADLGSSGTKADTAVKLIRLYANVSIHPDAGRAIAVNEAVIRPLIRVLAECRYSLNKF